MAESIWYVDSKHKRYLQEFPNKEEAMAHMKELLDLGISPVRLLDWRGYIIEERYKMTKI